MRAQINLPKELRKKVLKSYDAGMSMQNISDELNVKVIDILSLLKKKGIEIRKV